MTPSEKEEKDFVKYTGVPRFTFLNHASFMVETEQNILIVDPWLQGTAFDDGWALVDESTTNEGLIHYLELSEKKIFIWYSHEHSDHLSMSFLRQARGRFNIQVIYQKTLDRRVYAFFKKQGLSVIESNETVNINDDLSIKIRIHENGDSLCLIKIMDTVLLNINDCVIKNEEEARKIKDILDLDDVKIDILFTQFGYANWIGNEENTILREEASVEKLNRIKIQESVFSPKIIIPFASFIYFCKKENFYMNDMQNTPKKMRNNDLLKPIQNKIFFLKPYDRFSFDSKEQYFLQVRKLSKSSEKHWENCFQNIEIKENKEKFYNLSELNIEYKKMWKKLSFNFILVPQMFQIIHYIRPLSVKVTDLNLILKLSFLSSKIQKNVGKGFDISVSSSTLNTLLKYEYGLNTTLVNGKFYCDSEESLKNFKRFFSFQEFYKIGYGINNFLISFKKLVYMVQNKYRNVL